MFRFGLLVLCLVSAAAAKPAEVAFNGEAQNEFAAFDLNGDGVITKSEMSKDFAAEGSSVYDQDAEGDWDLEMGFIDADSNGCISDSEVDSSMPTLVSLGIGQLFADMDTDGDGQVSLGQVYPAGSEIGFMDSNSDGVIDSGEVQAMQDAGKSANHYALADAVKDELAVLKDASGCVAVSSMTSDVKKSIMEFVMGMYIDMVDKDEDGSISLNEVNTAATEVEEDAL